MHRRTTLKMAELNPLLTCLLCEGYLIDATTLVECSHSFCRSCLVRYLSTSRQCPACDTVIHKTRPLLNLRVDRTLQSIVYKLAPGLFKNEMKRRRDFYADNPARVPADDPVNREDRGEVIGDQPTVSDTDDETAHLSLEYYAPQGRHFGHPQLTDGRNESPDGGDVTGEVKNGDNDVDMKDEIISKRYIRCPAAVCVKHIKKFIRNKFELKPSYQIEITHLDDEDDPLPDDYTLMDVACLYAWRRKGPLPLAFRAFRNPAKKRKAEGPTIIEEQFISSETNHRDTSRVDDVNGDPPLLEKEPKCIIPSGVEKDAERLNQPPTIDPASIRDPPTTCKTEKVPGMGRKRKNDDNAHSEDMSTKKELLPPDGKKRRHWRNGVKRQTHNGVTIHDGGLARMRNGPSRKKRGQERGHRSSRTMKRTKLKILMKKPKKVPGHLDRRANAGRDGPPVLTRIVPN